MNLIEGGTTVPHGTLLFIERLMFVDREVVSKLNKEYREVQLDLTPAIDVFHYSICCFRDVTLKIDINGI